MSIFGLFSTKKKPHLDLMATMWPSFPHFNRFANDERLCGIRLNTAMYAVEELEKEFSLIKCPKENLYFDIKGRQLRVVGTVAARDHLELEINHPIKVKLPTVVIFKAGADWALLKEIKNGTRLIFDGGPEFLVAVGESLHIKDPSLRVGGEQFSDVELDKLEKAKRFGITKFFLSYVQNLKDVNEFISLVGSSSEIVLKIEDEKGLRFVAEEYKRSDNLSLMAARGDLYVELERPHTITKALKLIIDKDPKASVGSRIMLSVVRDPVPECADFLELAWMYDIGYRKMMLCDEICLKEELLSVAVDAFDQFRQHYTNE